MSSYYVWHKGHSGLGRDVIVKQTPEWSLPMDKTNINRIILRSYNHQPCKDSEGKVQGAHHPGDLVLLKGWIGCLWGGDGWPESAKDKEN